jgi:ankyrin repeat protein
MSREQLMVAAMQGDTDQIRSFLSDGIDPNYVDPAVGNSALYNATYCDQVDAMKLLLDRGADPNLPLNYHSPVDNRWERHVVVLMYARSLEAAKTLIMAGADVNATDELGRSPLICAVRRGNEAIVTALLEAGANSSHKSKDGRNALAIAREMISKYKSWDVGTNTSAVNQKVNRYSHILEVLSSSETPSS